MINDFIAKALGFSKIAFTGLDLAFTDNKMYATGEEMKTDEDGYLFIDGVNRHNRKVSYVKDRTGQEIPTRDDYLVFIRQFEEILEEETSLSTVINTSTKGAYVNGMDYIDFEQFMAGLIDQQVSVDETIAAVNSETETVWAECIQKVFEEVYSYKTDIEKISNDSEYAVNELQTLLEMVENDKADEYDNDKLAELRQKLSETREKIMKNPILQTTLQGVLWEYAKNYNTNNVLNKDVLVHNFKQDKKMFEETQNYSLRVLMFLNFASERMTKKLSV